MALTPTDIELEDGEVNYSRSGLAEYALQLEGERGLIPEFRIPESGPDVYGIDVSHWQGIINWASVPLSHARFAVAKCSQGKGMDKKFARNWSAMARQRDDALAAGRHFFRSAYHFFRPDVDARKQAEVFCHALGRLEPGDLPPALDVEWAFIDVKNQSDDRWDALDVPIRIARIRQWLDEVEATLGVPPMIYSCAAFWNEKIGAAKGFDRYPLWLADYSGRSRQAGKPRVLPASWQQWHLWQFTDNGRVVGIDGPVDLNRSRGGIESLAALARVSLGRVSSSQQHPAAVMSAPLPPSPLRRGDHSKSVESLQRELVALGHLLPADLASGVGNFGQRTLAAVLDFQQAVGLSATGEYDDATRDAMQSLRTGWSKGTNGLLVQALQKRLVHHGLMTQATMNAGLGIFGSNTEASLKRFQEQRGLKPTGVLDQASWAKLVME